MHQIWMRTAALLTACLAAGCYNYAPLTTPSPEPGTYLAVTLTDSGSYALTRYLGPDAFVVRGRYVATDERGLLVSVSSVELHGGWEDPWKGETVALPTSCVASLHVRRFSKSKSYLLAAAGAGGVLVAAAAFAIVGSGTPPTAGSGPPGKQ
jgi:hypothetical protein